MHALVRYYALVCSAAWLYIACSKHYVLNVDHSTIYSYSIYFVDSEHENASSDSESGDSVEDINLEVTSAGLM